MKICNIQHRYASSSVPLHPDIPWDSIALKYELTGGFIKNAVLSALLRSVSRSSEKPLVLEEDIVHGCSLQMRGSLRLRANSDSIVPSHGLDRLILNDNVRKTMESVISFEKARSVLFGQWRFDETMQYAQGTVMLVTGPHGCGKRAVCEGLAFELGRPMRVIDVSELMLNMTAGWLGVLLWDVPYLGPWYPHQFPRRTTENQSAVRVQRCSPDRLPPRH
jgi:hypothetical protein